MTKKFKVIDYDIIYLSYDEPNAEKNYADLCSKVPWAKRVHGVKGSDAAHKACAELSETDRFITVDGDNVIDPNFLQQEVAINENEDLSHCVFSWPARNQINGLIYGNGGLKCWPKQHVLDMKTHENADPNNIRAQVDFCWDTRYILMEGCFSKIMNNSSPKQAWRAGFREGVKMSLDQGAKINSQEEFLNLHWKNLHRLWIWLMIGADVKNGQWAIYGARQGLYKTMCTDWDYVQVRDFEYLDKIWETEVQSLNNGIGQLKKEIINLGEKLIDNLDIPVSAEPLNAQQSIFFKTVYKNPSRINNSIADVNLSSSVKNMDSKYDIVMITYNEKNADQNYEELKKRFPRAKRVDGVKGIHNAHKEAAKICDTSMFWVVDGDAKICENFNFDYVVDKYSLDAVHVWRCKNPINDLVYGYGGVKLLPRLMTLDMDTRKPDMTTSISRKFKLIKEISNITNFNTDEYSTWRSSFRECAKLSSKIIDRQKDDETNKRLEIWKTVGADRPFGEYAIKGANAGSLYGEKNRGNLEALKKINDFDWLKEQFDARDT